MLKLKKHVLDFLKATVKPDCLDRVVKNFEDNAKRHESWVALINGYECLLDREVRFSVSLKDFEEVEELKPYVWYPREKWDGNPKKYWVNELCSGGNAYLTKRGTGFLYPSTTHFMYIEPFEEQDHDAS